MLIEILAVIGVTLLLTSLIANVLLWKAGERQMIRADAYEQMYANVVLKTKDKILQTYLKMKELDDREIFSKDDEVGISFRQMLEILQELNEITQEESTQEE